MLRRRTRIPGEFRDTRRMVAKRRSIGIYEAIERRRPFDASDSVRIKKAPCVVVVWIKVLKAKRRTRILGEFGDTQRVVAQRRSIGIYGAIERHRLFDASGSVRIKKAPDEVQGFSNSQ